MLLKNIKRRLIVEDKMQNRSVQVGGDSYAPIITGDKAKDIYNRISLEKKYNHISAEKKLDLAEAAAEIQRLLGQLSKTYPSENPAEQLNLTAKAVATIESNPTIKSRIVKGIQAGGAEAIKELINHPAINILMATLEGMK
jgi:hypothetical protein